MRPITPLDQTFSLADVSLAQRLFQRKMPLVAEDARADSRLGSICNVLDPRERISLLILPILSDGELMGSLGVAAIGSRLRTNSPGQALARG